MRMKRARSGRRVGRPQAPESPIVDLALTIEDIERDLKFGTGPGAGGAAIHSAALPVASKR